MRVLVVTTDLAFERQRRNVMQRLGIACDYATLSGSTLTLQRADGTRASVDISGANNEPNGNAHQLLQQYDAVLVYGDGRLSGTQPNSRTANWTKFSPCPPIVYHRIALTQQSLSAAGVTLPSDFPIRTVDASNLPSSAEADAFRLQTNTTANGQPLRTAAIRVQFTRENRQAYLPAYHVAETSAADVTPVWLYRLDLAKHSALGANGEILATPISEDLAFPTDAFVAYRYRHTYWLPSHSTTAFGSPAWSLLEPRLDFWTLYGLKLAGVPVANDVPLVFCIDDTPTVPANLSFISSYADWGKVAYTTYEYLAQFYRRTGCVTVCGLFMGGRYNRASEPSGAVLQTHWDLVMRNRRWTGSAWVDLDSATQSWIQQWHQLLLREHTRGLPCTIHDHTIRHRQNRVWSSFTRHSDSGYAYAAPNDVPKRRAPIYIPARGEPPAGAVEVQGVDGERYYALYPTDATRADYFTGTGETITNLEMMDYYGARVAWESAVAEMHALGFPDAHGGNENRLIISPNFLSGGPNIWRVLYEIGYRAVRTRYPHSNLTLTDAEADRNVIPIGRAFGGLRFFDSQFFDIGTATAGTYGLYSTAGTHHAVGILGLDLGNDITGIWGTDREVAARRAFRRMVGYLTHVWLACGGGTYLPTFHPPSLTCADTSDPLRRFDVSDPNLRFNLLVELYENMAVVVELLYGYVRFGTVADVIDAQARYCEGL